MQSIVYGAAGAVLAAAASVTPAGAASPREIAVEAITQLFGKVDPAAVDRYFSPTYRQHNITVPDGPGPLRDLVAGLQGAADWAISFALYALPMLLITIGPLLVIGVLVYRKWFRRTPTAPAQTG